LHKGIDKKFSYELKNAFFIKKARPSFDGRIKFWLMNKQMLPIGFLKELKKTLGDYAIYKNLELDLKIIEKRQFNPQIIMMPEKFVNGKELRDYQSKAVDEFLRNKIAIIEAATGSGKNIIAAETIRRLGYKTLFIIDKIELVRQTKQVFEECLGIKVGSIVSGQIDRQDITVATIQSLLAHLSELKNYLSSIRFVIFDEAHHCASKSMLRIANYLPNTEFRLLLTGSAFRDDGNDMAINSIGGYKCFDLSAKVLIENGWLVNPSINFYPVNMDKEEIKRLEESAKTGLINESDNYMALYKLFIMENNLRNQIVIDIVKNNPGKKILILTKLIEHGQILTALTGGKHMHGSTEKDIRKDVMEEFKVGHLAILVSTVGIWSEGVDFPRLDILINCSANRGDVKSIQMLGRILRKSEGKNAAVYYDFIDDSRFFRKASHARMHIFRKEGHEVSII
jgi:DNA excision repair protein ERCC-3